MHAFCFFFCKHSIPKVNDPSQSSFIECTVYEKKKTVSDRIAAVKALFATGNYCKRTKICNIAAGHHCVKIQNIQTEKGTEEIKKEKYKVLF